VTTHTSTWHGDPTPPSKEKRAVPGTVIGGRYHLRAAIGNGGMGTVWQAADSLLRRDVAVKEVLLPVGMAPADRTAMYERTLREARAAAALSHPSVVQVYDVVTEGGRPWIVMELLHARSLADMIIADGPVAPRAVAKIGVALLGALEVAHSAGVLHRDVKPANILICTDGRCVLTDFGVARMPAESTLTTPGMVLGSPHFISPERAVGGSFGPPSDLFSLGVSLFTAVEGRPPFDKGDPFETMRAVVEEPPARPVRSGTLAPVLYGLLEKDPHQRWDVHRARQVLRELLAGPLANGGTPQHVTDPYTVVPVAAPPPPRHPEVPSGQIGGRAMLAPGESPSDRRPSRHAIPDPATEPGTNWVGAATGAPATVHPFGAPPGSDPGNDTATTPILRSTGRGLLARFTALPKGARFGLIGGVAAVLVLAALGIGGVFGGAGKPSAAPSTHPSSAPPPFPVQTVTDERGFSLEVPATWSRSTGSTRSYYDYSDPQDSSRWMRINVEPAGSTPKAFMQVVVGILGRDNKKCPAPYATVNLRSDLTLDGRPAAELEYTCGTGPTMRHGIWRATVVGGKAYEFYLTTEDSRFAESKAIYDHAVESYKLSAAG
jgi:eukaryotic-like serine/threonine-protein kinase